MLKTNKKLRLKTKNGRFLNVVREHYVRDDIICHSQACQKCQQLPEYKAGDVLLASDLTHYVVPDIQVTSTFLEVFEFPEIQGILFFQTVINHLQHHGSRKLVKKIKELTNDKWQGCAIFSNEFCQGAYAERLAGETLEQWQQRNIFSGAKWYYNHLEGQIPIVMITNDRQTSELFGSDTLGVFVLSIEAYLNDFYCGKRAVLDLYESLQAVVNEEKSDQQDLNVIKNYAEYLPIDVLEAGIKSGRYCQGCLNVNKHNSQSEAYIQSGTVSHDKSSSASDIMIQGMTHRNRAIHEDLVVVELLPKAMWKGRSTALNTNEEKKDVKSESRDVLPTGHVVGVLQRNWRDYVATFVECEESQRQGQKTSKVLVVPWDYRIPRIRISTRQMDSLRDHRIVVRIDSWDTNSMYPTGHFVRSLGVIRSLDTEISTIMLEHSLFVPPFTDSQVKELPSNGPNEPWVMDTNEIQKRRDLRSSHLVFSIDPKGCEDVDDTLSVRQLSGGNIEFGVHIADVTYFVNTGSLTDAEARSRSTTVYLADRRYDMLPEVLSADLCSLISGVDRYAMSVIWEMDSSFNVTSVWYGRTVITSSYKLFYEAAQAISEGQATNQELLADIPELQGLSKAKALGRLEDLKWSIMKLMEIARHFKSVRNMEGALELEGLEVQVQLDDKKDIKDLTPRKPLEVHETIAECMIFANHWVAKKIAQVFPTASLLRRHPLPRQQYFADLIHCAESRGFSIETSSNKLLADSLDECVDLIDPTFNKILRTLATQAMSNALYFSTGSVSCDEYSHYGLALDRYTHFTSPIRRYADVIVHRLLLAAVGTGDKTCLLTNKELEELCHHINTKHRAAQLVQKESVQLFETLFFQSLEESDERRMVDAVIFSIRSNGFLAFVPKYGIKGPVYLKDRDGKVVTQPCHANEGVTFGAGTLVQHKFHITVHNTSGIYKFNLFDHVQVRVSVSKSRAHCQSLRMDLISLETRRTPPESEINDDVQSNKMKRSQLVKEVQSNQKKTPSDAGGSDDYKALLTEYGQTHPSVSLYTLMENFRALSLLED